MLGPLCSERSQVAGNSLKQRHPVSRDLPASKPRKQDALPGLFVPSSSPAAVVDLWLPAAAPLPQPLSTSTSATLLPTLFSGHSNTASFELPEEATGSQRSRTSRTATARSSRREATRSRTTMRPGAEYCLSSCLPSHRNHRQQAPYLLSFFASIAQAHRSPGRGLESCWQGQ